MEPLLKQRFELMSKGWVTGPGEVTKAMVRENRELVGQARKIAAERYVAREAVWRESLADPLRQLTRKETELKLSGKS